MDAQLQALQDPRDLPILEQGVMYPPNCRLEFPPGTTNLNNNNDYYYPPITLIRASKDTQFAYGIRPERFIKINHHYYQGEGWGCVYLHCLLYRRKMNHHETTNEMVFQAPVPGMEEYVAIKMLSRAVVRDYLINKGGQENPYTEIARMQQLDSKYVINCIEALYVDNNQNDNNNNNNGAGGVLCIVMPQAEETLTNVIFNDPVIMEPIRIRNLFLQLFRILVYLKEQGISHRDIKPDNFLILQQQSNKKCEHENKYNHHHDHLVVSDMAMSIRMPLDHTTGQPVEWITGQTIPVGTLPYMAPEMFNIKRAQRYNGTHIDLWAAMLILYNFLSCKILYAMPHTTDRLFIFYIMARGLSSEPDNEMTRDVLRRFFYNTTTTEEETIDQVLDELCDEIREMGQPAVELMEHVLKLAQHDRWSLEQAAQASYLQP